MTIACPSQAARPSRHAFSPRVAPKRTAALTVLELLVSCTVLSLLIGLLLPAVQMARESARQTQCKHHLRQLGGALHHHHAARSEFPPGWQTVPGTRTAVAWGAALLPYLDQSSLSRLVDRRLGVDSPLHASARQPALPFFLCVSDVGATHFTLFREIGSHESSGQLSTIPLMELPPANYIGVFGSSDPDIEPTPRGEGPMIQNRGRTLAEFQRGTSHVLLVGERTARKLASTWIGIHLQGEDANGRVTGQAWIGPNREESDECEFASRHPGGVHFAWGDGHVTWLADEVEPHLYPQLATLGE